MSKLRYVVSLGPIEGLPEWHEQSRVTRYSFPNLASAERFAASHGGERRGFSISPAR